MTTRGGGSREPRRAAIALQIEREREKRSSGTSRGPRVFVSPGKFLMKREEPCSSPLAFPGKVLNADAHWHLDAFRCAWILGKDAISYLECLSLGIDVV